MTIRWKCRKNCGLLILGIVMFGRSAYGQVRPAQNEGSQVVARSGQYVMSMQDYQDLMSLNMLVLETALTPAEQQEVGRSIVSQFQKNPTVLAKNSDKLRQMADIARRGSLLERTVLAQYLWNNWCSEAPYDSLTARWVAIIKLHNPPIVTGDGLVVTKLQVDAMFASNDWVAQTAGLPISTVETRNAFIRTLPTRFPAMSRVEKEQLAYADRRWAAFRDPILVHSDLTAKAVSLVHQNVHRAADIAPQARQFENSGLQFAAVVNQAIRRTTQLIGGLGAADQARNLGVFNVHMAPH